MSSPLGSAGWVTRGDSFSRDRRTLNLIGVMIQETGNGVQPIFDEGLTVCYIPLVPTPRRVPSPAKALNRALGAHLKALRKQAGLRQQDVAAAAQRHGLSWTATTVGAVESGWREIRTSELFVLPLVLAEAGLATTFDDVCPPSLVSAWMKDRYTLARNQALSRWGARERAIWLREVGHEPDIPKVIGENADGKPIFDEKATRREPLPERIEEWAAGEAELAAAAKLALHPHQIALRAWRLWKQKQWQHPAL